MSGYEGQEPATRQRTPIEQERVLSLVELGLLLEAAETAVDGDETPEGQFLQTAGHDGWRIHLPTSKAGLVIGYDDHLEAMRDLLGSHKQAIRAAGELMARALNVGLSADGK